MSDLTPRQRERLRALSAQWEFRDRETLGKALRAFPPPWYAGRWAFAAYALAAASIVARLVWVWG